MEKQSNIPNRIKQPSTCCVYCGKGYKKKSNYEKHLLLCEIVYRSKERKTKTQYDTDEDNFVLPSPTKMYLMLLEMAEKYTKLEARMEELGKWVNSKKKKINVLEWLNNPDTNNKPELVFDQINDLITVLDSDIEFLFNHSLIETINQIFTHSLYTFTNSEKIIPLQMFSQKTNTFYIYNKTTIVFETNSEEIICWHELSKERLSKFLNILHVKLIKVMNEWRKNNKDRINESDSCAIVYDKAFAKLMNIDFKCDSTLNKIKSMIYGNMKTDITNFIQYEFQF